MNKNIKVIIIFICTVLLLVATYSIKNNINKQVSYLTNTRMIKNGKYLYFSNDDINSDGSTKGTLLRVSKDGKEIKALRNVNYATELSIYKNKLYFVQGRQVCRISLDGSNFEIIDDFSRTY